MSSEGITEELRALEKKKKERSPDYTVEILNKIEKYNESDLESKLAVERKKREELELIVGIEAEKKFMTDKENLLQKIVEGRRDKISDFIGEDPEKIESVKASLILQGQDFDDENDDDAPAPTSPAGKVTLQSEQGGHTERVSYQNPTIQKYSDLYSIIRSPTCSEQEKSEAEQILDNTFNEIGKGLRSRSRNNPYSLPTGVVTHCMNCGMICEQDLGKGIPCPHCQHRFGIDKFPRNPRFQPT